MGENIVERVDTLKRQVEDLINRWPAHSVPRALIADFDEVEENLANLVDDLKSNWEKYPTPSLLMAQLDQLEQDLKKIGQLPPRKGGQ